MQKTNKFILSTLFALITSSTSILAIDTVNSNQINWRYGEGVCKGSWAYKDYAKCRHESFGVESYKIAETEKCGVAEYNKRRDKLCGVETYNTKQDKAICGSIVVYKEWSDEICGTDAYATVAKNAPCPSGYVVENVSDYKECVRHKKCRDARFGIESETAKSCEHSSFGVRQFKECALEPFGVAKYKSCRNSSHGVENFNVGVGNVCGMTGNSKRTQKSYNLINLDLKSVGLDVIRGMGSACTTCDDLPNQTASEVKQKFLCLKSSLLNGEKQVDGFSQIEIEEAVKALKFLQKENGIELSPDEMEFIDQLYLKEKYENLDY